jgi:hypothetical protein
MAEKSAERLALEAEASLLEIPFGSNWKDATIADKIAEAKAAMIAKDGVDGSGDVASVPDDGGTGGGDTAPAQPDPAVTFTVDPELEPGAEGAIIVTGPKKGRWRAGRHFTSEPQIILVSDLEPGQREAIQADPKLTVEFIPPED